MKYLSLFTGIGGFELGINQAYENIYYRYKTTGASEILRKDMPNITSEHVQGTPTCIGYSEIDKPAISIYQKHFPNHKNYGDITTIDERELPDFDLIVGGFPCQSFSIAGKRGGFEDTRGTLFFDIARIIKHKRPRFLLLENVKGLLSHDEGRTFRTIIAALDELGYDVQWQVLNSKNFGVPQNRERVFIVGHLRGTPRPEVFPIQETDGAAHQGSESGTAPLEIASTIRSRNGNGSGSHIEHQRVYDLKATENSTRRGKVSSKGYAKTLDHNCAQAVEDGVEIRRLTPVECERLQAYPDGWTKRGKTEINVLHQDECDCRWCIISDTQRYKTLGNGVTTTVVQAVIERMFASIVK